MNLMQSILTKSTRADRGFVNRPVLTPHLQFRLLENKQVLLVSEFFNTLINGDIYCHLLPLLDGFHTIDQIAAKLDGLYSASDIFGVIFSLSARGYIVSAEHSFNQGQAAYWTNLGASPCWAEERLGNTPIAIAENDNHLIQRILETGVTIDHDKAQLTVVTCKNYLDSHLLELNKLYLNQKKPWILVRPSGIEPMLGPVFGCNYGTACWDCLATRLRCHQEVHEFLRNVGGQQATFDTVPLNPDLKDSVYRLFAAEIMKWIVLGNTTLIHNHVMAFNTGKMDISWHKVVKRPQCVYCGDNSLNDPNREPLPIILESKTKSISQGEGTRTVSADVTLAKYKHLVSPISGIASWLSPRTDETNGWLHVHWAGSNLGLKIKSLNSLRRSLRSKSAGKGSTRTQSEVGALCEAIERYSGGYFGDEIRINRAFEDFSKDSDAIHPNDVQLFSDYQLDNAEEINSEGHPYNMIPQRFDHELIREWTPVWSLTQNRHLYLPTTMLYFMLSELRKPTDLIADSNGCAAGNTLEEAILQGFYELVERDAFAIWWYNRLQMPSVNLNCFDNEFLNQAKPYYETCERDLWVLDITSDIGIPTYVAISNQPDGETEDIIYGAGTHPDPKIAVTRAICELNQCLSWMPKLGKGQGQPAIDEPKVLDWFRNSSLQDCSWLVPATENPEKGNVNSDKKLEFQDLKEEIDYCRGLVEDRQMEFLVLDQTRPDIGLNVVRVIVPGLRHFWPRMAPGRLYEVPVAMGYNKKPLKEFEMNEIPVFA